MLELLRKWAGYILVKLLMTTKSLLELADNRDVESINRTRLTPYYLVSRLINTHLMLLSTWWVKFHFPGCPASLTLSSPSTLLAAINLFIVSHCIFQQLAKLFHRETYSPPCQLPSPRIASACTLVMRNKFSVSERLDDNCASCELSCACFGFVPVR